MTKWVPPPTVAEIKDVSQNGLKVISTFSGGGGSCTGWKMAGFNVVLACEFVEAAAATYEANWGTETPVDRRDIRTISGTDLLQKVGLDVGELDVFEGSPPCFPAGTPVVTARGILPVEQVIVGDVVLTHANRWRRVTETMEREAEVGEAAWGSATFDHPFWAREQVYEPSGWSLRPAVWRPAGELRNDHRGEVRPGGWFVATPTSAESLPVPTLPVESPDFWWIVGRWLGDGWVRRVDSTGASARPKIPQTDTQEPCVICGAPARKNLRTAQWTRFCTPACARKYQRSNRRRPRADFIICAGDHDVEQLAERLSRSGLHWQRSKQRTADRFTCSSRALVEWIGEHFGAGAEAKTLPGWLLGASEEIRQAVFDGYVSADGHESGTTTSISTVSASLAVGIKLLGASLGLTSSLAKRKTSGTAVIEGRTVATRDHYEVRFFEDDGRYTVADQQHRWQKVRTPLTSIGVHKVYDITVEEDHSFVAWGLVVHNCSAFSSAGSGSKKWGKESKYSDDKVQRVDDLFYEFTRLLGEIQPKAFTAENVSGLVRGEAKGYFIRIFREMEKQGYNVACQLVDASALGVPQRRLRTIFMGYRNDLGIEPRYPIPQPGGVTLREAIGDLSTPVADHSNVPCNIQAWWACQRGAQSEKYFSLRRCSWDEVCPTITATSAAASGAGMMHPDYPRSFNLDELTRLCAFPADYKFVGSRKQAGERMGRAVPPVMMREIAKVVAEDLLRVRT